MNLPATVVVVDVANVMGSRPDGWWRDRAVAARRLTEEIALTARADEELVLVLEGAARSGVPATSAPTGTPAASDTTARIVHAPGGGDDTVVLEVASVLQQGRAVVVVTADRGLRDRVVVLGAECRGPRWLLDRT